MRRVGEQELPDHDQQQIQLFGPLVDLVDYDVGVGVQVFGFDQLLQQHAGRHVCHEGVGVHHFFQSDLKCFITDC